MSCRRNTTISSAEDKIEEKPVDQSEQIEEKPVDQPEQKEEIYMSLLLLCKRIQAAKLEVR
jgi:hypothetical protein